MQPTPTASRTTTRITYSLLREPAELEAAAGVVRRVWGEGSEALASLGLLRAYSHFGNPVIGAFDDQRLCGVSIGFLAAEGGVHLHSHITGVEADHQLAGVGFGLKLAQRDWCLRNGIGEVTWTFDPLLARNAHFNMRKLGALSHVLLVDFYGEMPDAINIGDATDRLEVHWLVTSPRVRDVVDSRRIEPQPIERYVQIPDDYATLRKVQPDAAGEWRSRVREELIDAFAAGLQIVDFDDKRRYCLAPVVP